MADIEGTGRNWRTTFLRIVAGHRHAGGLKQASLDGRRGDWTRILTLVAVDTCQELGWQACAKGHPLPVLPEVRSEYLTIDVVAFPSDVGLWQFPVAAIELENSADEDRIAYSLWKVLCLRAALRIVYCYRQSRDECAAMRRHLEHSVLAALSPEQRHMLHGETVVVIGTRDEADTFPYAFFKWFVLDHSTATLRSM